LVTVKHKPRVAVVSPFLDKSHGTERMVVEWISRLTDEFDIHLYSQQVQDLDLSTVVWHRIPMLPGPHLFNFLWWFAANHIWRFWDRRFRGLRHDLVFSPGPNCLDADAVSVHIVFAEFLRRVGRELKFTRNSVWSWPRLLHRRIYYRLAVLLERNVYTNPRIQLILTSGNTAAELERFYGRTGSFPILYAGIDHEAFNPARCGVLREETQKCFGFSSGQFVLFLIGNDWRKKGLPALLDALAELRELPIRLLVVTRELDAALRALVHEKALDDIVCFLPPRKDVEHYFAAADAYVGPSLEDTYALPAVEAMACGLPVVISSRAGASHVVTHGVDGLILNDPTDAAELAGLIRQLYADGPLRHRLGERAAATASQFTWESNARDLAEVFKKILLRKSLPTADTIAQES
jgi:UDP-glucose:(heptosyl)LPS alpha-1,3-glucosyltransferase